MNQQSKNKRWSGKTILLVDDDESCSILISEILMLYQANFVYLQDGYKAINYCMENKDIDLVLMDIKLHDINGCRATKIIKKFLPKLPIIAFTACLMPDEKDKCFKAGCDDLIPKPFNEEDFFNKIDKYLKVS